jgi:hypothetical protein
MKDLITRIKTLDYKQVALNHGEKIGMGIIGVTVVACLALTNWASEYTGEPRDLEEQAAKVDRDLKNKGWPEELQKEFIPNLMAEGEVEKVTEPLEGALYDWGVAMSPKLYQRQLPADEAKWLAVSDLNVRAGAMPMGVYVPPEEEPAEEAKPRKPEKRKRESESGGIAVTAPLSLSGPGNPADMGSMMSSAMGGEKARGVRFVCVVGVIDVRQQQNLLRSALHVDTLSQAAGRLEYVDFKVQRQRAVPGPNPWRDDQWKDWSTESSIEELNRASDFDPDIVATKYTNQVVTSPLPHRLDGEWDAKIVAPGQIPTLTEEEQDLELAQNKAAAKTLAEEGAAEEGTRRRGFAGAQKDANKMRSQASGSTKYGDYMSEMMKGMSAEMGKMGGAMQDEMRRKATSMMSGMMSGGGMNLGMYGGAGGGTGMAVDLGAEKLLFRYFDFDVEPGECYRYRIKLIVENPSFEEEFVSAQAVAQGETRETDWSAPSPPVVVPNDVEFALTRVSQKHEAELKVVGMDPDTGTLLMDTLSVGNGAYVGTPKKKTLHLDLGAGTLKEEEVSFSSRELMVDSAGGVPAKLAASAAQDLKIESTELAKIGKSGKFDMAVTLNRFGELVPLDAGSRGALGEAEKRVKDEREPYKDQIETSSKKKKDDKAGKSDNDIFKSMMNQDTGGKKKGKRGRVDNPIKGGMMSGPGGMMAPGIGMPPMTGPSSRPPRSGGRNN